MDLRTEFPKHNSKPNIWVELHFNHLELQYVIFSATLAQSQPSPILQRNVGRRTVEASCANSTLRILNFRFDPCHMGFPAATWRDGTLKLEIAYNVEPLAKLSVKELIDGSYIQLVRWVNNRPTIIPIGRWEIPNVSHRWYVMLICDDTKNPSILPGGTAFVTLKYIWANG